MLLGKGGRFTQAENDEANALEKMNLDRADNPNTGNFDPFFTS